MAKAKKTANEEKSPPDWLPPLSDPRNVAILGAAYNIFAAKGFRRATMLDIATAARASKETLYSRFGSKEKLFEALLAWGSSGRKFSVAALADAPVERAEDALCEAAIELLTLFYRPETLALDRMRVAEGLAHPELGRITEEIAVRPVRDALAAFFGRLVRAGVVPMSEAHAAAESYVDILLGILHERVLMGIEPPPDAARIREIAARATRVALRAFAPPPAF